MPALQLLHTLTGHTDRVWCCAWSPNGKALATCSGDRQIRIWLEQSNSDGASEYRCQQILDGSHSRTVRYVAWSPNGKFLATAGFDGITAIWENVDGEFECIATLEGHENEVKCVAWSKNGQLLATCSRDKSVWIWSADTSSEKEFECLSVLNGHTQDVKVAKWHPTIESMLLSASYDNTIKVWTEEDDDWYATETLTGHTSTVWGLTFNPTGTQMASCSDDKSILIWERSTTAKAVATPTTDTNIVQSNAGGAWKLVNTLTGYHSRCIYTIDWSSNNFIASGGADDAICIFGPSTSTSAATQPATTPITSTTTSEPTSSTTSAATSTSSTATASTSSNLALLHCESHAHSGDVNCVSWRPPTAAATSTSTQTKRNLLASAGDDGVIKIWQFTE